MLKKADINLKSEKCKSFFCDNSGEVVYCEKYHFTDESEIYLNGVTGKINENRKAVRIFSDCLACR
ncbi:MAG: hypothetical protein IJC04_07225 [Oscillospiraceae bacterium]|nr:hypothetical protein [Oscillospiraceae bacterium]